MSLTGRQQRILDFESRDFKYIGVKEQLIRECFNVTATGYYMELNALLDHRAAIEYAPALTARLRAKRVTRLGVRRASYAW